MYILCVLTSWSIPSICSQGIAYNSKEEIIYGEDAIHRIYDYPIKDLSRHAPGEYLIDHKNILVLAIELLGKSRKKLNASDTDENKAIYSEKVDFFYNLVQFMISNGANVNSSDCPISGSQNTGINVDKPQKYRTPLMAAMEYPNMMDIVKLLLEKGATKTFQVLYEGKVYTRQLKDAPILDEYKELLIIGEL